MMDAAQYMNNRISRWDGKQKDKVLRREIRFNLEAEMDGIATRAAFLREYTGNIDYATAKAKELPE